MAILRSITFMHPALLSKYKLFDKKMKDAGLKYKITSVARTVQEQMALYMQGREPLSIVNKYRKLANLSPITLKENIKVTWTLKSLHLINLEDDTIDNDVSKAFDIALFKNNKLHWDIKVSVNNNDIPDYIEAGIIGESVGLVWGGRFKNSKGVLIPDYPHFQI